MTTTRCAISATTPRSWVISMIAEPSRRLEVAHQVEDLRLDGDVERRGRLVGDQQLRVAGQRHGDHHPLPHAAGELVRIFAHPPRRRRDADQGQHLDRPRSSACARVEALVQPQRLADLAADGQHRVQAGHRLLEDHADVVAAQLAHLGFRQLAAGRGPGSGSRRRSGPAAPGSAAGSTSTVTDLPQPLSPTMARVSPASMWKERPSTARTTPSGRAEMRLQVLDLEQGAIGHSRFAMRGSSASRSPSPSRFTASTVIDRNTAGKKHDVGLHLPERPALGHDVAPGRDDRRRAGADEGQDRLGDHRRRRRCRSPAR